MVGTLGVARLAFWRLGEGREEEGAMKQEYMSKNRPLSGEWGFWVFGEWEASETDG